MGESAKLVASYPGRLKDVIAGKGAYTKYCVKGLSTYVNVIFPFLNFYIYLHKKKNFFFAIMGYCV
jgi:hypothetical protein